MTACSRERSDLADRTTQRKNNRKDYTYVWSKARDLTPRERELFEETEFTKPVDFHSYRRSFKQAFADAGVELQTAMALSGATDAKAHQRYLNNTSKLRQLPAAALLNNCIADELKNGDSRTIVLATSRH